MNINIGVGSDSDGGNFSIDFSKRSFVLLAGASGTGKSIFHNNLYRQLTKQNTPQEVGFIFLDMTHVDFASWKSPYIITIETRAEKSIEILETLAHTKNDSAKHIFIHIEECDMFVGFTERAESAVKALLANRKDVTLIYSTSKLSLRDSLLALVDMKIMFEVGWEKTVVYESKTVFLKPFSQAEVRLLDGFCLPLSD